MALDRRGTTSARSSRFLAEAIGVDNDLGALTDRLAATTRAQTDALIAQNRERRTQSSRNLFVGVGAASILLALRLGFVFSRSLVDPFRKPRRGSRRSPPVTSPAMSRCPTVTSSARSR